MDRTAYNPKGPHGLQEHFQIKHVIYLTLENHSFDNIAGYWDFHPEIDNLRNLTFCNDYTNPNWTVYGEPLAICAEPDATEVPLKDPDHNFGGVTYEIFRQWNPTKQDVPKMAGFIERQSEKYNATPGDSAFVIKALNRKKTATLVELASNFAFFDSYVGSSVYTWLRYVLLQKTDCRLYLAVRRAPGSY